MNKPWFAPKRYGYGSGLPISWEGWVVLVGFFACIGLLEYFFMWTSDPRDGAPWMFGGVAVLVVALVLICRAKTEGGWRWRNGGD